MKLKPEKYAKNHEEAAEDEYYEEDYEIGHGAVPAGGEKPRSKRFLLNSFIAGGVANLIGLAAGHPCETIIIRQQLLKGKAGGTVREVAYDAIVNEGPLSLFKGLTQPMIGAVPINIM